jgi:hypothetical protein
MEVGRAPLARGALPAPSVAGLAAQGSQNAMGRPLFELLKDARSGPGRPESNEQVAVIRHQHPPQQPEPEPTLQTVRHVHKCPAEGLAVEPRRPPSR